MYTLTTTKKQCGDNDSNLSFCGEKQHNKKLQIVELRVMLRGTINKWSFLSHLMNWAQF